MTDFPLLRPKDLPDNTDVFAASADQPAAKLLDVVANAILTTSGAETRRLVHLAADELATVVDLEVVADDPTESASNRALDRAFGIVRVRGDGIQLLRYTTMRAYRDLLDEQRQSRTTLPLAAMRDLHTAFRQLFGVLSGTGPPDRPPSRDPVLGSQHATHGAAMRRWNRGHHVFMALVQGLVIGTSTLSVHLRHQELDPTRDALRFLASLMRGSAVALSFTGDFPYSEYERRIRPTLLPPMAAENLSGLRWRDHEYLIKQFARLRPWLADVDHRVEPELREFTDALDSTYDAHKNVCAHFIGTSKKSLLMSPTTHKSAVDVLDSLKHARTRLFETDPCRQTTL
jgi:hypothetical protein